MWVPRTVVLASVLMMFISDSASKPQIPGVSDNDNEFLNQLGAGDTQVWITPGCPSPSDVCVPFNDCCDPPDPKPTERPSPSGFVTDPTSGAQEIFDSVNPKNVAKPCSGLDICCEKMCKTASPLPPPSPGPGTGGIQCGIRNTEEDRIISTGPNQESTFGEFPWMVAVLLQGSSEYVGGGSLVHPRVVLTAAHKIYEKSGFIARLGDWDLSAKTGEEPEDHQNINVQKVVVHPQFSRSTLINNVALLILETDSVLGSTVMPICLPEPNQVFDGLQCTISGWGKNELEGGTFQAKLKKVDVPAVTHNDCQSMLRNTRLGSDFNLDSTFNCAGGDGEDSCEGDGGSPLICPKPNKPNEYVQMGVTAWGIGCGIKGHPGVYGSVPKTVDWINQIIDEEGGTQTNNPRG